MKKLWLIWLVLLRFIPGQAQIQPMTSPDSILNHKIEHSRDGKLLAWYQPEIPGAAYLKVVDLAARFVQHAPVHDALQLPVYFISCCFHHTNNQYIAEHWAHNPACVWAGLVQGLVLDYRVFTGDSTLIDLVRTMLDYQLAHGTTPADWPWPNIPFASADPFQTEYRGSTEWEHEAFRGDGLNGIEPDKVGELGVAYLHFYQVTEEPRFLTAAIHCAEALAGHVRQVLPEKQAFAPVRTEKSPWPFRVNAKTGQVISEYCSNVLEPIRLFDELIRSQRHFHLSEAQISAFQSARNLAWEWLYSINGPMVTFIWNGYFEDVPNDSDRTNRVQITPLEMARYLIKNPEFDPRLEQTVPALLSWVASAFATDGMPAIKEQTWCYEPMGSHTARYASICALWYAETGDPFYREQAGQFFNLATYMCDINGYVSVGPNWPGAWWSDGYGDYIRHFMEGIAAIPEWAPGHENHLLKSSSVIQQIKYRATGIQYSTFHPTSREILRLIKKPTDIRVDHLPVPEGRKQNLSFWEWQDLETGGVLTIYHSRGRNVRIQW